MNEVSRHGCLHSTIQLDTKETSIQLFALRTIVRYTSRHSCLVQVKICLRPVCDLFAVIPFRFRFRCVGDLGEWVKLKRVEKRLTSALTNQKVTARLNAKTSKGVTQQLVLRIFKAG